MRLTLSILFLLLQLACLGQTQPASVTVFYQTDLAALRPERVGFGSNAVVRVLAGSISQPWATGSRLWRSTFTQPAFFTNTAHSVTIATNAAYPRSAWWISEDHASPIQDATWYGAPTNAWTLDASGNLVLGGTDIRAQLLSVITAAANALQRSNHLGTQPFATLTGLPPLLSDHGITNGAQLSEFRSHTNLAAGAHGMSTFGALLATASNSTIARAFLLLGTGATLDVPASGNAASTNLVKGDDTRLGDSRAPTAHTHPSTNISDSGVFGRSLLAAAAKTNALDLLGSGRTGGSSLFLREDGSFATPPTGSPGTNGIPDAPNDSNAYTRKGLAWTALNVADLGGVSMFLWDWLNTVVEMDDARTLLELIGGGASPIDSAAKYAVRTNSTGGGSVRHRLNLIQGTNVVLALTDDAFSDETDVTLSVTNIPWPNISGTPTNFAGYGISDAATDTELAAHAALTSGVHGITAFGASLVDDTTAAAARLTLGLGTGSTLNVAASGDAAAGELMKGNDSRNTDARTPLSHTHPWADVTGEPTTLDGYGITDGATDAELAAHAALTTGAHGMSTFGAGLVDDANAAAARATLGLGTVATLDVPASGNATTNQVMKGSDTRITGLQAALDAKLSLTGGTLTGPLTLPSLTATNGANLLTYALPEASITPPTGISVQNGPGASNGTLLWTYPYGTKLTVFQGGNRAWELMNTNYPAGAMAFRIFANTNWSSWRVLLDSASGATTTDLAGHTNQTTGAHGMSAFGASLVDDATAADARVTLGVQSLLDAKLPLAGGTVSGTLSLTGIGSDVSSAAAYRFIVRDPATSELRPMSASYARGQIDAAATSHGHVISDMTGLQAALDAKAALADTQTITGTNTFTAPLTATNGILTRAANGTLSFFAGWDTDPSTGVARFVSANPTQVQGYLGWSTIGQLSANQTWAGNNTFSGALLSPGAGASSTKVGSATASGDYDVAVGDGASATGGFGVAIGKDASSTPTGSISIGAGAAVSVTGGSGVAVGTSASVNHYHSVAIGYQSATTADSQVRLGKASNTVSVPGILSADGGLIDIPTTIPTGLVASPASGGRLYVYFNGGGKIVLAMKFPDGSSVNIATQP